MRKTAWLLVFTYTSTSVFPSGINLGCAQERERPATCVMDLRADGIPDSEARSLTNRLMVELFNTGAFELTERDKRDEVLREQGFQLTGACDETSCLMAAGSLLGVKKMIGGSVGKVGNVYTVSLRLIDVETGKIERTATCDYAGSASMLLLQGMRETANKLVVGVRSSSQGTESIAVVSGEGSITVHSIPLGASVYLDGNLVGVTPITLDRVSLYTTHTIRLKKSGFLDRIQDFKLTTDDLNQPRHFRLEMSRAMAASGGGGRRDDDSDRFDHCGGGRGLYTLGLVLDEYNHLLAHPRVPGPEAWEGQTGRSRQHSGVRSTQEQGCSEAHGCGIPSASRCGGEVPGQRGQDCLWGPPARAREWPRATSYLFAGIRAWNPDTRSPNSTRSDTTLQRRRW